MTLDVHVVYTSRGAGESGPLMTKILSSKASLSCKGLALREPFLTVPLVSLSITYLCVVLFWVYFLISTGASCASLAFA